jgi:hypothetical protein
MRLMAMKMKGINQSSRQRSAWTHQIKRVSPVCVFARLAVNAYSKTTPAHHLPS